MDRPTTEAPQTQIYFIKNGSGAFLEVRLRAVVRGERASRSIVNRTTVARPLGVVGSLILAGSGSGPAFAKAGSRSRGTARSIRGTSWASVIVLVDCMASTTIKGM